MLIIKMALSLLSVFTCVYLGKKKADKYKLDKKVWQEIVEINSAMINNQLMYKNSVITVLQKLNLSMSNVCIEILKDEQTEQILDQIDKQDKELIIGYFSNLGKGISVEQIKYLNDFDIIAKKKLSNYTIKDEKYSSACIKLGFLIGVAIFILVL